MDPHSCGTPKLKSLTTKSAHIKWQSEFISSLKIHIEKDMNRKQRFKNEWTPNIIPLHKDTGTLSTYKFHLQIFFYQKLK